MMEFDTCQVLDPLSEQESKDLTAVVEAAVASAEEADKRACSACKKQRKRCDAGCRLARFFPASQAADFDAVHRVFGTKNLLAMLDRVADEEGKRAVRDSLVFEATQRLADPRNGCCGLILGLQNRVVQTEAEMKRLESTIKELTVKNGFLMRFVQTQRQQQQQQQPEKGTNYVNRAWHANNATSMDPRGFPNNGNPWIQ
ncbi:hypothetical protein HPP92_023864 [Vanilla planifolia]|uniref:LOB domain-containing protein n=1 Tax=Vanilla planifolia TaxID=51239 RepID=A0A835PQY0_VANPL|nr:hypothetical protein HPP92_023864 [Vanilla planifolia]